MKKIKNLLVVFLFVFGVFTTVATLENQEAFAVSARNEVVEPGDPGGETEEPGTEEPGTELPGEIVDPTQPTTPGHGGSETKKPTTTKKPTPSNSGNSNNNNGYSNNGYSNGYNQGYIPTANIVQTGVQTSTIIGIVSAVLILSVGGLVIYDMRKRKKNDRIDEGDGFDE